MVNSNASRFGKKAMSLFLSGAMVVAFAPAIGAVVSEPVAAFAAHEDVTHIEAGTVSAADYLGTPVTPSKGALELTQTQINKVLARQTALPDATVDTSSGKYTVDYQDYLSITSVKTDDNAETLELDPDSWYFSLKTNTTVYTEDYADTLETDDNGYIKNHVTSTDGEDWTPATFTQATISGPAEKETTYYRLDTTHYNTDGKNGVYQKVTVNTGETPTTTGYQYYTAPKNLSLKKTYDYLLVATANKNTNNETNEYYVNDDSYATVNIPVTVKKATAVAGVHYKDGIQTYVNKDTDVQTYDGTDQLKDITVEAWDENKKALTQGTDFAVITVKAKSDWNKTNVQVSEAIDVGNYLVYVVDPEDQTKVYATLKLQITAANVLDAAFDNGTVKDGTTNYEEGDKETDQDNTSTVTYTGSAIDVTPTFYTSIAEWDEISAKNTSTATKAKSVAVPSTVYTTKIEYTNDATGKTETVTEVKGTGTYKITMTLDPKAEGADNFNMASVTYYVNVVNDNAQYLELDASSVTFDENGYVLYSGTAINPKGILYTVDTENGGKKSAIPETAYTLVLKKATSVNYLGNANGYQTVDAVNGPGFYSLTALDASKADEYTVSGTGVTTYFYVTEKAEEPVVVEKQDQDIKFTTGKNQKLKKGKKLQLKVTGAKTAVTYTKKSGSAFLTVSKSGKIKVDSSAKKGKTYHINVKAKAAASDAYNADTEVKHFCIKVK